MRTLTTWAGTAIHAKQELYAVNAVEPGAVSGLFHTGGPTDLLLDQYRYRRGAVHLQHWRT